MVFNQNICMIRHKSTDFCYYISAKEAMKYIGYKYRDQMLHDYSKAPVHNNSGQIDVIPDPLKVKVAKEWESKLKPEDTYAPIETTSDWTYSTPYKGTVEEYSKIAAKLDVLSSSAVSWDVCKTFTLSATEEKIPVERLTPQNPIQFFQDRLFFEDELDDFGKIELRIRFRAMGDCAFGLMRCYLR